MLRIIAGVFVAALCACSSTWTIPPGSEEPTVFGAFTSAENRIMADIMKFGFPGHAMIRYREGYVLSYDGRHRVPLWVAERLNPERLEPKFRPDALRFRVDTSLPEGTRSQSLDFRDSGYIRGRMAAFHNHLNDRVAASQTYYLSNVVPMNPEFRQAFWVPFEKQVRAWARESDDLYVVTGPLVVPFEAGDGQRYMRFQLIGTNQVAVPTHFYKVMLRLRPNRWTMQAFLVPHDTAVGADAQLGQFLTTVDEIERLSGLDFFPDLSEPTQSRLESRKANNIWGE